MYNGGIPIAHLELCRYLMSLSQLQPDTISSPQQQQLKPGHQAPPCKMMEFHGNKKSCLSPLRFARIHFKMHVQCDPVKPHCLFQFIYLRDEQRKCVHLGARSLFNISNLQFNNESTPNHKQVGSCVFPSHGSKCCVYLVSAANT